ncbi:MAG: sulfatase [Verrucomicrobiota bacterium]
MCLLLAPLCAEENPKPATQPNILLFLADDQGWTGTSALMDRDREDSKSDFYQTPALERFAEQGMRFSQGYSPHPNCSPTRMSIQTGKSPARLGSTDILDVVNAERGFGRIFYERFYLNKPMHVPLPIGEIPKEEVTIAEFIKEHRSNYATAHFGKWHMKGGSPADHGYDEHDGPTSNREGNAGDPDPKLIGQITESSVDFMRRQAAANRPFLLQVSHYAVHTPILIKAEALEEFEAMEPGEIHTNAGYAAMTRELDGSLETLLAILEELDIADSTYVIYTSDNGGEIGAGTTPTANSPLAKGKTHTWEGGVRVPLIVRGPGIKANSQSDVPVIGWDFFPTFAELLGIEAALPENIDGGSFAALLHGGGEQKVERPTGNLVWYYPHYRDNKGVRPQAAIRSGNYKLRKEFETEKLMLFDLSKDIGESTDLSAEFPEVARKLDDSLMEYLTSVEAELPTANADYDPEKDLGKQQRRVPQRGPRARPSAQ